MEHHFLGQCIWWEKKAGQGLRHGKILWRNGKQLMVQKCKQHAKICCAKEFINEHICWKPKLRCYMLDTLTKWWKSRVASLRCTAIMRLIFTQYKLIGSESTFKSSSISILVVLYLSLFLFANETTWIHSYIFFSISSWSDGCFYHTKHVNVVYFFWHLT